MLRLATKMWLASSLSLARLFAALIFASLAFQNVPVVVLAGLYGLAMTSDLLDGRLARKLHAESHFGKVLDLVSDKSLTIVSLLYAAERGVSLLPLALVAAREVIMIGARTLLVRGKSVFPTSRIFGGLMAFALWGNTLFLVLAGSDAELIRIANLVYWVCAGVFVLNVIRRVMVSIHRIKTSWSEDA